MEELLQKQRELSEVAVFWEEISQHLPRSRAREELGDEVICGAFRAVYPKIKSHLLTEARKKWLEEEIERIKNPEWGEPTVGYYIVDKRHIFRLEAELKALKK